MTTLGDGIATMLQDAAIDRAFARQQREANENAEEWRRHCERLENEWQQRCKSIEKDRDALLKKLWEELGESGALYAAVRRLVPFHPLVSPALDPEHQAKAVAAGVAAGKADPRNFNAPFKAGLDLVPPSGTISCERYHVHSPMHQATIERLQSKLDAATKATQEAKSEVEKLRSECDATNRENAALRESIAELGAVQERTSTDMLEQLARHVTLHHAYRSALTESDPDHPTLSDPAAEDFVAQMAFRHLFKDPTKFDWAAVREIGENWAVPSLIQTRDAENGHAVGGFDARISPREAYDDIVDELARERCEPPSPTTSF